MVIVQLLPSFFLFSLGAVVRSFVCSFFRRRLFDQGGVQEWEEKIYKHTYTYTHSMLVVEWSVARRRGKVAMRSRTHGQIDKKNKSCEQWARMEKRKKNKRKGSRAPARRAHAVDLFSYINMHTPPPSHIRTQEEREHKWEWDDEERRKKQISICL
jgi:hypothetical protein